MLLATALVLGGDHAHAGRVAGGTRARRRGGVRGRGHLRAADRLLHLVTGARTHLHARSLPAEPRRRDAVRRARDARARPRARPGVARGLPGGDRGLRGADQSVRRLRARRPRALRPRCGRAGESRGDRDGLLVRPSPAQVLRWTAGRVPPHLAQQGDRVLRPAVLRRRSLGTRTFSACSSTRSGAAPSMSRPAQTQVGTTISSTRSRRCCSPSAARRASTCCSPPGTRRSWSRRSSRS